MYETSGKYYRGLRYVSTTTAHFGGMKRINSALDNNNFRLCYNNNNSLAPIRAPVSINRILLFVRSGG